MVLLALVGEFNDSGALLVLGLPENIKDRNLFGLRNEAGFKMKRRIDREELQPGEILQNRALAVFRAHRKLISPPDHVKRSRTRLYDIGVIFINPEHPNRTALRSKAHPTTKQCKLSNMLCC